MIKIENRDTLRNALHNKINLFLGAGFSVLAQDKEKRTLPVGGQLAEELRKKFSLQHLSSLDLQKLYTVINSTHRDEVHTYLQERFTITQFDERYRVLENVATDTIFTTNIDNLIHRIYENSLTKYINDLDFNGPVYHDKSAVELVMLHGSVLRGDRPLRFGTLEVSSSFGSDPNRWRDLQTRLKRYPTLFWGYSLEDAATLESLAPLAKSGSGASAWIIVRPDTNSSQIEAYYRALNLQIILADTADFLDFVIEDIAPTTPASSRSTKRNTHNVFPNESLPNVGEVVARPSDYFLRGATPIWYDIFSGLICRTSYFNRTREAIYSRKHVIITGIPACGKTTLMMQLASEIQFDGHKLIVDELTLEKALLIIRKLGTDRALVFIDNYTDDVNAFSQLASVPTVQLVGADRDFSVSNNIHRISKEKFNFIDITGLTQQDLQNLRQSIPEKLRTSSLVQPSVTRGVRPSIFEFVQANIKLATLHERVIEAMHNLRSKSPTAAEMLLFTSYVHHCFTPVSMDMAIAYWRNRINDYNEIYSLIDQVGASIADYQDRLADEPQDYFAARSSLVADIVIQAAGGKELRQTLERFYTNLSPVQICHYRVFSRRAYDSKLIVKAFPDWVDGIDFYDRIYQSDPSYYVLQQAALYLSERDRHSEAYSYINRALMQSGGTNWTIRNSHAIILFRTNIVFWQDSKARETLDQSMLDLSQCYQSDRRKSIHAMVFADHATRYNSKYRDSKAQSYLLQAKQWLAEVKQREPWLDNIERLEKLVAEHLDR